MVNISEVKGNARENRTAAHTHIKGLGLRSDGYAESSSAGFVGQVAAREVLKPSKTSIIQAIDMDIRLAELSRILSNQRRCQVVLYY